MHGSRPLSKILLPLALAQVVVLALCFLAPAASAQVMLDGGTTELGTEPIVPLTIGLRGTSKAGTSGAALSLRLDRPAGLLAGDLMVASLSISLPASGRIQAPSGWQLLRRGRRLLHVGLFVLGRSSRSRTRIRGRRPIQSGWGRRGSILGRVALHHRSAHHDHRTGHPRAWALRHDRKDGHCSA
jgi:hypothetical protein